MSGDQIMYATQTSLRLFIVDHAKGVEVSANILHENMYCHYEDLLIEFTSEEAYRLEHHFHLSAEKLVRKFRVEFEVKHFYFDILCKSVQKLSHAVIGKIMPTPDNDDHNNISPVFQGLSHLPASYIFLELDKQSQLPALEKVISNNSQVPVLVSGAFGTGKTRLLAVATYHFIEQGRQERTPTRVLICCHHQTTADMFINEYFGKMVEDKSYPWKVKLIRLIRFKDESRQGSYHLYKGKFEMYFWEDDPLKKYMVIVSTFLTAFQLHNVVHENFITHILLDEAAQIREPEAVAPLCMANQNTKIVIAGDDRQVGPSILVLGNMPQHYGLSKSLFTRLLELYCKHNGQLPIAVLNTNYRCHKTIVSLAHSLFYSQDLQSCANPTSIPGVDHAVWFVCSSLNKTLQTDVDTNQDEARALIDQLKFFFKDSVREKDNVCVLATNRNQLSDIRTSVQEKDGVKLAAVKFLPSYLIQGNEFSTLFISTVESVDSSGCSYNPTKSLCSPIVFNTAITRAKNLIVAVGNPYTLMTVEENTAAAENMEIGNLHCWAKYLDHCFEENTVILANKDDDIDDNLQNLHLFVQQKLQKDTPGASLNVEPNTVDTTVVDDMKASYQQLQTSYQELQASNKKLQADLDMEKKVQKKLAHTLQLSRPKDWMIVQLENMLHSEQASTDNMLTAVKSCAVSTVDATTQTDSLVVAPDTLTTAIPPVYQASSIQTTSQGHALSAAPTMRELLERVAHKANGDTWEMVALVLDIDQELLEKISRYSNPIRSYSAVFDQWRKKEDPPFTWAVIIDALQSPVVGEDSLAREIEQWLRRGHTVN